MNGHGADDSVLRAALDSLMDPVVVLETVRDDAGRVVDFTFRELNAAACRVNRRSREDTIGRSMLELFPAHVETGLLQAYAAVADSGVPAVLNDQPYPDEVGTGEIRFFDIRAARIDDGITLTWRDVTDRHRAAAEHLRLEEQFRSLAEHSSDVVYFTGPDRRVLWVSPAVEGILGWRPDQLVGTVMADLLHPDDRAATEARRTQAYTGERSIAPGRESLLVRVRSVTGDYRWIRGVGSAVRGPDGTVVGAVGAWHDVDDLIRTQETLESDRAAMRATLDGLMDPVIYFRAVRDHQGRITDYVFANVNEAACAYNRASREELQGSLLSVRYPDMWPRGLFDDYVRATEEGTGFSYDDWPYGSTDDGEPVLLDVRGVPAEGGVIVTFREVTERYRRQRDLEASETRFRQLAENTSDIVYFADPDGSIQWISGAVSEVLGLSTDSLIGTRAVDLVHPDDLATAMEARSLVYDADRPSRLARALTVRGRTASGDYRWMSGQISPVVGEDGTLVGVVGSWHDVDDLVRAQDDLAAAERRYRLLSENVTDIVLETGPGTRITWASSSAESLFAGPAEGLIGRSVWDLVVGGDDEERRAEIRRQWSNGGPVRLEVRREDGATAWMEGRAAVIRDEQGVITGAVIGMTDVTATVLAERAAALARQAEERTRLSMDEAAVGLLITDRDGTVRYVNDAMGRIVEASASDIVGTSILDGADPGQRPMIEAAIARLLAGESERELVRQSLEPITGTTTWVDTFLSPVRDAEGRVDGLLLQVIDVTAEIANRDALQRSAEHFRRLAENASDVVYETDTHGLIRWVSPSVERAMGWEPESLIGTRALDLVHPDDRARIDQVRSEVYRGVIKEAVITRFLTMDRGVRTMAVTARPLWGAVGEVAGAVVSLHDVTEEARMRSQLERSERTFRTAMLEAPQGMALANLQDLLTDVNPPLAAILGETKPRILGRRLSEFLVPADPPQPTCAEVLLASGDSRITAHEHRLATPAPDGSERWVSHAVSVVRDEDGSPQFFVHHVQDVTVRHHREEELGYRASHDLLTGLLNRDGLMDRLGDWLPERGSGRMAVLFCDLDGLKGINDEHGHSAGDAVLVEIARRLEGEVRRGDIVARFGGDEFLIVLDRIQSREDAMAVAAKICAGAAGPVAFEGQSLPGSISVGVAVAAADDTAEDLIARADEALYRAKHAGRGRVAE